MVAHGRRFFSALLTALVFSAAAVVHGSEDGWFEQDDWRGTSTESVLRFFGDRIGRCDPDDKWAYLAHIYGDDAGFVAEYSVANGTRVRFLINRSLVLESLRGSLPEDLMSEIEAALQVEGGDPVPLVSWTEENTEIDIEQANRFFSEAWPATKRVTTPTSGGTRTVILWEATWICGRCSDGKLIATNITPDSTDQEVEPCRAVYELLQDTIQLDSPPFYALDRTETIPSK